MNHMRLLGILIMLTWAVHAQAQVLVWSGSGWVGESVVPGETWQIAIDHARDFQSLPAPRDDPAALLVMTLSTNDAGRTFFVNTANSPGFARFVANLTDGTNGWIRFQNQYGYRSWTEAYFMGRSPVAPDLAGYNITSIGFRVQDFYDYYEVGDDRYDRQLDYSLDFYSGPIGPQPTAASLALRIEPVMASLTVTGTPGAPLDPCPCAPGGPRSRSGEALLPPDRGRRRCRFPMSCG